MRRLLSTERVSEIRDALREPLGTLQLAGSRVERMETFGNTILSLIMSDGMELTVTVHGVLADDGVEEEGPHVQKEIRS